MTPALLLAVALAATPAKPHPYTVHDQVSLRRLQNPRVSPDGKRVAFQLRTTDLEANRGRFDLWVINLDGTGLRQLTTHPENDTDPAWAPDGQSLFFLSSRGGSSQVWRLALDGGEATAVTKSPIDVDSFNLSRDGQQLAFAAETYPDCDSLECTEKRLAEKAKVKSSGKVYDSLFARHWDTWRDGRRAHLFVQKVVGGTPVDTMKKLDADAPSKPFGGSEEYTFTPDGKGLVFTARVVGREEAWSTDLDLFSVPVDGSQAPRKLTTTNRATDTQPVFSPDGKTLAYLAMKRPGYEADQLRLVLRSWPDGKERVLAEGWDRSVGEYTWTPDGSALVVTAQDVGQLGLFSLDVATGTPTKLLSNGNVLHPEVAGHQVIFSLDSLAGPADVATLPLEGPPTPRRVTHVNADLMEGVKLGEFEQFEFKGAHDDVVHGYLVKPVGYDPKKKYPVAFLIHGGPQGSFGNDWHYRWNPQVYAAHGYAAVMIDFHGSTGYGQKFTDAIRGDWGGGPLIDLQQGLAAALAKYPALDKDRVCALGASYGGFMINWIAGNWNEPFKCLVAHDGNIDERSAYLNTEELWFPEWEHGGTPWENPAGYSKHNPIDFVSRWKVPMLVVHGGKDYRVVDTEGLSTFTAAQRRGVPSKLLYFPDENHWVLKPANSILWHDTVLGWLDQWTAPKK